MYTFCYLCALDVWLSQRTLLSCNWKVNVVICLEKQPKFKIQINSKIVSSRSPHVEKQEKSTRTCSGPSQAYLSVALLYHIDVTWVKNKSCKNSDVSSIKRNSFGNQKVYTFFCLWVQFYIDIVTLYNMQLWQRYRLLFFRGVLIKDWIRIIGIQSPVSISCYLIFF